MCLCVFVCSPWCVRNDSMVARCRRVRVALLLDCEHSCEHARQHAQYNRRSLDAEQRYNARLQRLQRVTTIMLCSNRPPKRRREYILLCIEATQRVGSSLACGITEREREIYCATLNDMHLARPSSRNRAAAAAMCCVGVYVRRQEHCQDHGYNLRYDTGGGLSGWVELFELCAETLARWRFAIGTSECIHIAECVCIHIPYSCFACIMLHVPIRRIYIHIYITVGIMVAMYGGRHTAQRRQASYCGNVNARVARALSMLLSSCSPNDTERRPARFAHIRCAIKHSGVHSYERKRYVSNTSTNSARARQREYILHKSEGIYQMQGTSSR